MQSKLFLILSMALMTIAAKGAAYEVPVIQAGYAVLTASSEWDANHRPDLANFGVAYTQVPTNIFATGANDQNQYLQVNFASFGSGYVKRILIRGRTTGYDQWVRSFKVQYSTYGINWYYAEGGKVYNANTNPTTVVSVPIVLKKRARIIRIIPVTWNNHISFKAEVYVKKAY